MLDCPLLTKCPYANDIGHDFPRMSAADKERYCKADYAWCGRYLAFEVLQRELERFKPSYDHLERYEAQTN